MEKGIFRGIREQNLIVIGEPVEAIVSLQISGLVPSRIADMTYRYNLFPVSFPAVKPEAAKSR